MNQNLINPEIVMRSAREREMDLRREMRGLPEAESMGAKSPAWKLPARRPRLVAALAWMFSIIAR